MGGDKDKKEGSKTMDWMYKGNKSEVNKEEYLLGKSIDKNYEHGEEGTLGQINAVEYDCTPASIFSSKAEHQVDIQNKLKEDPLASIRKKELDERKHILDNPIKMKEINAYIKKMKSSKKKKKKEKKKKKKKKKKKGGFPKGEKKKKKKKKKS